MTQNNLEIAHDRLSIEMAQCTDKELFYILKMAASNIKEKHKYIHWLRDELLYNDSYSLRRRRSIRDVN